MILAGIAQLTATLIGVVIEAADGAGLGAAFGGSSGVVVLPLLVIGGLFLLAGSLQDLNGSGPGRVATGGGRTHIHVPDLSTAYTGERSHGGLPGHSGRARCHQPDRLGGRIYSLLAVIGLITAQRA